MIILAIQIWAKNWRFLSEKRKVPKEGPSKYDETVAQILLKISRDRIACYIPKEANIENRDSTVKLSLNRGMLYFLDRSLQVIDYETMQIFQNIEAKPYTYESLRSIG